MFFVTVSIMTVYTLRPRDYDSFAAAILSQNHREIGIAELISASIKVIIALPRGFPNNGVMTTWPIGFESWEESPFFSSGGLVPLQI